MFIVKRIFLNILSYAVVLYLITQISFISLDISGGIITYAILGTVLGFLSSFIKPLLKLLVLPFSLLFGGIVTFVINVIFLYGLVYIMDNFIAIETYSISFGHFYDYLTSAIILSILSSLITWLLDN